MRRLLVLAHVAAGALLIAGIVAQIARPLAPDLGPLPDPGRWFDDAYLELARSYREPLYVVGLVALALRLAVPVVIAFTPPGRRLVDRVVAAVGAHRPAWAATVVILGIVVLTDLIVFPLTLWAGFVHEGAFGFRTQGIGGWLYDWLVAKAPLWLAVTVLAAGGWWLARRLPRAWPAVGAIAATVLTALVVFVAPLILEPLTFRLEPLEPGPVRAEVERVLEISGERIDHLYVADASRRTTKHNAYVSGLAGTRRVVLYDTLVEHRPPDEIGVILAHEIGHHRNDDHVRGVLFAGAGMVVVAYALFFATAPRARGGLRHGAPDPRAAAVVLAIVVLLNAVSIPVQDLASRRAEAAADLSALQITGDPDAFRRKSEQLARANLADPAPPRWAVLLWATHPPSAARLEMAERWPTFDRDAP